MLTRIPFKVSARTARLIGRENVATSKGAIIELVKNGYDADSRSSSGIIEVPGFSFPTLYIGEFDTLITDREVRNVGIKIYR